MMREKLIMLAAQSRHGVTNAHKGIDDVLLVDAILDALAEPDEAMVKAGEWINESETAPEAEIYRAMISAAKEGSGNG